MVNIINWLVPQEKKFFEMLVKQSEIAVEAAKELKDFVDNYYKFERSERKSKSEAIKQIELKGDESAKKIIEKLNKKYITPIDKEEIRQMVVLIDDVTDLINAVALRFVIFGMERIDAHIVKLAEIANNSVAEMSRSLLDLKKVKDVNEHYSRIHKLETEADEIYSKGIDELFHFHKNHVDIIKYKEVYELLEKITDKCEDVINVMQSLVSKH